MHKALDQNGPDLKKEFLRLFGHIQKIRKELAALGPSTGTEEDDDHFSSMSDQLDAIVQATEEATNTIMESMEVMEGAFGEIRQVVTDETVIAALDRAEERIGMVFEACSFQDITGQRINKVVKSLKFIEERVKSLVGMWRPEELKEAAGSLKKELTDEQKLLNGPQLKGKGVNQEEVDKLFSQDDIDKLFG
jgi:chemotaxis protein CheZ